MTDRYTDIVILNLFQDNTFRSCPALVILKQVQDDGALL